MTSTLHQWNYAPSSLFLQWGCGIVPQLPPHRNAGLEVHYIAEGYLHWRVEGRTYQISPGSVFYTLPWEQHGSVNEFEPGHWMHYVVVRIRDAASLRTARLPDAFGFSRVEGRRLLRRLQRSPYRSLPAGEKLAWLIPALREELSTTRKDRLGMASTLFRAVLLELERAIEREAEREGPKGVPRPVDRFGLLLRKLEENCAAPWTLRSLSQIAGPQRTHLGLLFKKRTGDSPITYLNRLRVTKAQEQLRGTKKTITEIAHACGFQSSQYFARTFKRFAQETPQQYRQHWIGPRPGAHVPPWASGRGSSLKGQAYE